MSVTAKPPTRERSSNSQPEQHLSVPSCKPDHVLRQALALNRDRSGGFIKLPRSLVDHPLWTQVPDSWFRVALGILLKANWKRGTWWDGGQHIEIPPGGFITSAAKMCAFCRVTRQQYRDATAYLARAQFITTQRTTRYELITVLNWQLYQGQAIGGNQVKNQQRTSREPSENQLGTTIEERKKGRSKESSSVENFYYSSEGVRGNQNDNGQKFQPLGDDDKNRSAESKAYTSTREELDALVTRATGTRPTRRDLNQLQTLVESAGSSLRYYIDDIRPRLARLTNRPRFGFFYDQARRCNRASESPDPEPTHMTAEELAEAVAKANCRVVAGKTIQRCDLCRGMGKVGDSYCTCEHGAALAKLESRRAEAVA